jgi:hypothetical protein
LGPKSVREDSINTFIKEAGQGVEWINLAQDTDQWQAFRIAVMNFEVP